MIEVPIKEESRPINTQIERRSPSRYGSDLSPIKDILENLGINITPPSPRQPSNPENALNELKLVLNMRRSADLCSVLLAAINTLRNAASYYHQDISATRSTRLNYQNLYCELHSMVSNTDIESTPVELVFTAAADRIQTIHNIKKEEFWGDIDSLIGNE